MADQDDKRVAEATQALFERLEGQGFFRQMKEVETNLTGIAGELSNFAKVANERLQETESMAAHILALQSVIAVLLRHVAGGDAKRLEPEITAEIKARTATLSGNPDGSPSVRSAAAALFDAPGADRG